MAIKKRDRYGIYEIPNYNNPPKKKKKNKKVTILGIIRLIGLMLCIVIFVYLFTFCLKFSIKTKALKAYESEDYQGAVDLFEEALKPQLPYMYSIDNDSRLYLADCYLNLEQYEVAVYEYEKIKFWSEKKDDDVQYLEDIAYGLMLYKQKDYRQALPKLQKAYEDGYGDLVLYVGSCYGQLGDYENMQIYYNIFLQNHEMNSFMYAQYASIELDEGNMEQEAKKAIANFKWIDTILGSSEKTVLECERIPRREARRSLVLTRGMKAGEVIDQKDVMAKRPGTGISPVYTGIVVGRRVTRDLEEDTILQWNMV